MLVLEMRCTGALVLKMASTKTTPNNKSDGGGNPSPEWSAFAPLIFLILGAMVLSRYAESIKSFLTIVVMPLVAAAAVGYYLYTIASSQPTTAQSVDAHSEKSMVRN
jgi:nitrate reductase NapE component